MSLLLRMKPSNSIAFKTVAIWRLKTALFSALQCIKALCYDQGLFCQSNIRAVQEMMKGASATLTLNCEGAELFLGHKKVCQSSKAKEDRSLRRPDDNLSGDYYCVQELRLTKNITEYLRVSVNKADKRQIGSQEHVRCFDDRVADQSSQLLPYDAKAINALVRLSKLEEQIVSCWRAQIKHGDRMGLTRTFWKSLRPRWTCRRRRPSDLFPLSSETVRVWTLIEQLSI